MAMKSYSPTSPSRRQLTNVSYAGLSKVARLKSHTLRLKTHAGRNAQGRITTRHQGGGNKKLYRLIDFKQDRVDIPARVEAIEYDPYRTAFIARVVYKDGLRSYVLAPHDLRVGQNIVTAEAAPLTTGNRLKLKNIPVGYQVYNVELQPGRGGQLARSAGSYAEVLGVANGYSDIKLSSGEFRRVLAECYASLGQVSNPEYNLTVIGKAGRSRWLGIRPTVRGSVMNPVDHPYGGGEGRTQRGTRKPKTLWGKVTGGHKTRDPRKRSAQFIIRRRVKK
ncbi:MAG TPA: 50S ribosomal protein L2 [Candidatus Paceibacterota bacterium]|nr:50S ribosomal protein L2 [Candidatus Paceibacterota bacterium]